jgi:hypothetical protein
MHFLKTNQGRISSRWIVKMAANARGTWTVEYSNGSGSFDAIATTEDAITFLRRVDPESAPE